MEKVFIGTSHHALEFCQIRFIDNTDPAGIDHQIAQLGPELASTLVIVISKVCIEIILFLLLPPCLFVYPFEKKRILFLFI